MGTSSRLFNNSSVMNHSSSQMNTNMSVVSENDHETVAVLWGTNFDVQEVERKIREFVQNFAVRILNFSKFRVQEKVKSVEMQQNGMQ